MDTVFISASESHVRREKEKARVLRKSQWWKNQLGRGVCHYCETRFTTQELTMDHKIPIVRGGVTSRQNVVVSCKPCNTRKKYYLPEELALASLNSFDSQS